MEEKIKFENHLKERVMEIQFPLGFSVTSALDINEIKQAWTQNLKRWHSPYTVVFDARDFVVSPEMKAEFEKLVTFFSKFFMRKIIGFANEARSDLPFETFPSYDEAIKTTGLSRGAGLTRDLTDLRSRIQVDNDFNAHVMDITFLAETTFETKEDIEILRSKLQNMLMLWHSPYSVVFNCLNLHFSEEARLLFVPRIEKFLKSFFCKKVIGYAPVDAKETYPFETFRARHQAAAHLENSGLQSGAEANCSTRKAPKL